MSNQTPWYVEHSKQPVGNYGAAPFQPQAEPDPENRKGTALSHHTEYESTSLQRQISDGLAILRDAPHRVVIVGGDWVPNEDVRVYLHIAWNTDTHEYELISEQPDSEPVMLKAATGISGVFERLDTLFNPDSFVFAHLIYRTNSPFNLTDQSRTTVVATAA
jgi:hypothetical protein